MSSSSRQLKVARKKTLDVLVSMNQIFSDNSHSFDLSFEFKSPLTAKEPFDSPLESVTFNHKTRRYESCCPKVHNDDFIAQAMVMLTLARLEFGWGLKTTLQQLSIWTGPLTTTTTDEDVRLPNLWQAEMKQHQLEKTASHCDGYAAFGDLYKNSIHMNTRDWSQNGPRKRRSSKGNKLSVLNELAEQATVQWAIERRHKIMDPHAAFLAAEFLRLIRQFHNNNNNDNDEDALAELRQLLIRATHTAELSKSQTFSKVFMDLLETSSSK